jgi:hypothetical protein
MIKRDEKFYEMAGFNSYRLGMTSFDQPYSSKTMEGRNWLIGYARAKREKPVRFPKNWRAYQV